MRSLPFARRIKQRAAGFTLVELMVAASLLGVLGVVTFGVLRSGTVLASQNAGINLSSSKARLALDQIGDRCRYAMENPALVTKDGADVTGTTADGVLIKRFIGTPYVVKESGGTTADIADTATTFVLEFNAELPVPVSGDWILMESISRPELEISNVTVMTAVGSVQRRQITTTKAIGEVAKPSSYRVGGQLYRKEAYLFAAMDATADPRFELRHISRVLGTTNYSSAGSYQVEANSYRRLTSQAFFTGISSNGADAITLRALVNSSDRQEYVSRQSNVSTFTAVPIQLRLWSLNR